MKRAFETSRSTFLQRYRSLLCIAAVAAFAVCMSPKASAQTYSPSSVSCLTSGSETIEGHNVQIQAQPGQIADPSELEDEIDTTSGTSGYGGAGVCTFTGFGTGTTTAPMTLSVTISFAAWHEPIGNPTCTYGSAYLSVTDTGHYFWSTTCGKNESTETYTVPAGTDLATFKLIVIGIANSSGGDHAEFDWGPISIHN
jgi:hypothetical protein